MRYIATQDFVTHDATGVIRGVRGKPVTASRPTIERLERAGFVKRETKKRQKAVEENDNG